MAARRLDGKKLYGNELTVREVNHNFHFRCVFHFLTSIPLFFLLISRNCLWVAGIETGTGTDLAQDLPEGTEREEKILIIVAGTEMKEMKEAENTAMTEEEIMMIELLQAGEGGAHLLGTLEILIKAVEGQRGEGGNLFVFLQYFSRFRLSCLYFGSVSRSRSGSESPGRYRERRQYRSRRLS